MKKFVSMVVAFVAVCGLTISLSGCTSSTTKKPDTAKKSDTAKTDAAKDGKDAKDKK